jgi:hypothetical protein
MTLRVNYFAGKLLTADDLRTDQDYLRTRLRRLNRLVHGFGIATGLSVKLDPNAPRVHVEPGLGITPLGEELEVSQPVVCQLPATGKVTLVQLRYVERPVGPLPDLDDGTPSFGMIEETFELFAAEAPEQNALVLARLVRAKNRWKLDRAFRRRALRRGRA